MKVLKMRTMGCGLAVALCTLAQSAAAAAYTTMTDLGGKTVSMSGGWNTIFGNGGGIKNGTLNADISGWWKMNKVTFTVGPKGKIVTKEHDDANGEVNFGGGATLILDGGSLVYNNKRGYSSNSNGFYLGDSADGDKNYAVLRIQNGGSFTSTYQFVRLGTGSATGLTGYLSVDGGTITLPSNRLLTIGLSNSGVAGLTNCTVKAEGIRFCENTSTKGILSLKDSTLNVQRIYKTKDLATGSSVTVDGVTFNTQEASKDILSNLGIPYQLDGDLTVNAAHDSTASGTFAGTGRLVKAGAKKLTLFGTYSSTGALTVSTGTLAFGAGVALAEGTVVKAADGATLDVTLAGGQMWGTPNAALALDAETDGTVSVVVTSATVPETGVEYKLFNYVDKAVLDRVTLPEGFDKIYDAEMGVLSVKLSPKTHVWKGAGTTAAWSEAANWDTGFTPTAYDSVRFLGTDELPGGATSYDLPQTTVLEMTSVEKGAWTNNLNGAKLQTRAVSVAKGAELVLARPLASNPLPTDYEKVTVAGVLDLGGAAQTISSRAGGDNGLIRDGFELRNGKITLEIPSNSSANSQEWCWLTDTRLTIGPGGHLFFPKQTDRRGQINFGGTRLRVDGGTFENLNQRYGAYVGNGGSAEIVVVNGGSFIHSNHDVILAYSSDQDGSNGALLCDHGTVNVGANAVFLGNSKLGESVLAMTNSTLTCGNISFNATANVASVGKQTLELVETAVTFSKFESRALNAASTLTLDGATLSDRGGEATPIPALAANGSTLAYTLGANGVTLKISDASTKVPTYEIAGAFTGAGETTLAPQGETPKPVRLTGTMPGYTGAFVVESGITLVVAPANGTTVGGGLVAKAGSTVSFPEGKLGTLFTGAVTLEDGMAFDGFDKTTEHGHPVAVLATTGTLTVPFANQALAETRNRYFVKSTVDGVRTLYYGMQYGTAVFVR